MDPDRRPARSRHHQPSRLLIEGPNASGGATYGDDVLRFGAGIDVTDLRATRNGTDSVLHVNSSDRVTVYNWYFSANSTYKLERVEFSNGATLSGHSEIEALVKEFWGTSSSETLTATGNIDTLIGGRGTTP